MTAAVSPDRELALLAAATARPAMPHHAKAITAAATRGDIDWLRFVRLVARHRVTSLAFDGLGAVRHAVPDDIHRALRTAALRDRAAALQQIGVLATVTARLADAGIAAASIKGATLGLLAFGDATLRQSRDVDVLIQPDEVVPALAALRAADFRVINPADVADDPDRLRLWVRAMKDVSLLHEPSGTIVELHWRLTSNPHLVPASVARSRQSVTIGALSFATLDGDDLLLYLCVHGARDNWFRLKWLADVHALLEGGGAAAIVGFYDHARDRGLDGPAGQMLLLLRQVYGLALPPAVASAATASRRVRLLTWAGARALSNPSEPEAVRFGTIATGLTLPLLHRNPRYAAREAAMLLVDWPVALRLGVSRWAYAVAIAGRPFFWATRKLARRRDAAA